MAFAQQTGSGHDLATWAEGQARQEQEVGPERPMALPMAKDHTPILRPPAQRAVQSGACQAGMTGTSRGQFHGCSAHSVTANGLELAER